MKRGHCHPILNVLIQFYKVSYHYQQMLVTVVKPNSLKTLYQLPIKSAVYVYQIIEYTNANMESWLYELSILEANGIEYYRMGETVG